MSGMTDKVCTKWCECGVSVDTRKKPAAIPKADDVKSQTTQIRHNNSKLKEGLKDWILNGTVLPTFAINALAEKATELNMSIADYASMVLCAYVMDGFEIVKKDENPNGNMRTI